MGKQELYCKLAVERCRLSLAQLCAAVHFLCDTDHSPELEVDTIHSLIAQIDRDLAIMEKFSMGLALGEKAPGKAMNA